jgi:hypothetical protein
MLGEIILPLRRLRFRPVVVLLTLLALVPAVFMGVQVVAASRNIVYWDEFDTVLDLLLKLDQGLPLRGIMERLFAVNNEHRMLTSRLIFVASWWTTGTVDFRLVGAIGNLFLLGLCGSLLVAAGTTERRVRLGVILAALMFQFEHFENMFWSGASIDHYQVVALAVGALILLARGGNRAAAGAVGLAFLATFTLAHGLVAWPAGAFLLWRDRRWPVLGWWTAAAALAAGTFFLGFEINAGHHVASFSVAGIGQVLVYWCALLGAPLALGVRAAAPWMGLLLLAIAGEFARRGLWRREPLFASIALFCAGSLALVAIGRSGLDGGLLQSRYMVLSALAWAALIFVALEHVTHPLRPWRWLSACLPFFVVFNVVADVRFTPAVEAFVEGRDAAALRYKQFGSDGRYSFRLYPVTERANQLLHDAESRGLYRIPRLCERENIENPRPSSRISYFIDEMTADTRAIYISGWAGIDDQLSERGEIYLVFRSKTNFIVYSTVTMRRPDVAAATSNPEWRLSGFSFAVGRWRLPPEDLQVGILIKDGDEAEFIMTDHHLRPYGRGEALLAKGE